MSLSVTGLLIQAVTGMAGFPVARANRSIAAAASFGPSARSVVSCCSRRSRSREAYRREDPTGCSRQPGRMEMPVRREARGDDAGRLRRSR
jgi:hypothetical protein